MNTNKLFFINNNNFLYALAMLGLITAIIGCAPDPSNPPLQDGQLYWDSSATAQTDSHQRIVEQAVELLKLHLNTLTNNDPINTAFSILEERRDILIDAANKPDFDKTTPYYFGADMFCKRFGLSCRGQTMYSDHFYDADNHQGLSLSEVIKDAGIPSRIMIPKFFTNIPPENAESQTRRYFSLAVQKWKEGDYEKALYFLGYGSHYFSDIFVPHHAANYPWRPLNQSHCDYEEAVEHNRYEIMPPIGDLDIVESSKYVDAINNYSFITDLITAYSNRYAKLSKSYLNDTVHPKFRRRLPSSWKNRAIELAHKNRESLSLLFYRFLYEVTANLNEADYEAYPMKRFNVIIKTGETGFIPSIKIRYPKDEYYIGFEFDDGSRDEYGLDTKNFYRWYSFNPNTEASYFLNFNQASNHKANEISGIYIGKRNCQTFAPWELESIEIYIYGQRSFAKQINKVIECGTEHFEDTFGGLKYYR